MSKLSDAIRRTLRAESAPMGFGAARPAPKATMVVGLLGRAGTDARGADVFVIDGRNGAPSAADIAKVKEANGAMAIGLWAREADRTMLAELRKSGLDFLLFEAESTPASALLEEDLGFVLAMPDRAEEEFLRSLEALQLDAVYVEDLPSPLTVASELRLMRGRRPIMARAKADADKTELETLRAAGVVVLLLGDPSGLEQLKGTVLSLPARKTRRDDRPAISIPRAAVHPEPEHEEEEDE